MYIEHAGLERNLRLSNNRRMSLKKPHQKLSGVKKVRLKDVHIDLDAITCSRCPLGSASRTLLAQLSELELDLSLSFLDSKSRLATLAACRRLTFLESSSRQWSWACLDLSYIKTYEEWRSEVQKASASILWRVATTVKAPRAKAIKVASEVLALFGQRLRHLDISSVDPLSAWDYIYAITERSCSHQYHLRTLKLPTAVYPDRRHPLRLCMKLELCHLSRISTDDLGISKIVGAL